MEVGLFDAWFTVLAWVKVGRFVEGWRIPGTMAFELYIYIYGGVHSHGGTPIAGWFTMENPMKVVDLGVPLFQETSISLSQKSDLCGFLCPIVKIQQGKLQLPEFNAGPA